VQTTPNDRDLDPPPPKDEDPDGLKLLGSPDVLERASKLLHPLSTVAPNNVDVWITVYDVAIRRKKLLQAVGALNRAAALSADHPELHLRLVDIKQRASSLPQTPPAPLGPIFVEALNKLIPDELSLETFSSQYLQRNSSNSQAVFAAAQVLQKLNAPLSEIELMAFGLLGEDVKLAIPTALSALSFLSSLKSPRADEFRTACQSKFELSTVFKTPSELAPLRDQVLLGSPDEPILEDAPQL